MSKNKKKKISFVKKITLYLLLSCYLFSSTTAYAWDLENFGSGDLTDMTEDVVDFLFGQFGADEAEVKYAVQSMNVMRTKKNPPQVSLSFSPENPVTGDKLTVVATPTYFMNSYDKLYFTWFLKTKGCERTNKPNDYQKRECNGFPDGKIDIKDYKVKAARIIANAGFNWEEVNYGKDSDDDGYLAVFGGDDQRGKEAYCYLHDTSSGDEYEIECDDHLFQHPPEPPKPEVPPKTGDGRFGAHREESFWRTDPRSDDTAHTGNVDEANVAGLGINTFTWTYTEGDEIGVVVEGISLEPNQTKDASYRTTWAMPKKMCEASIDDIEGYPSSNTRTISRTEGGGELTIVTETTNENILSRAANIATVSKTVVTRTLVTDTITGAVISDTSSTAPTTKEVIDIKDKISLKNIKKVTDLNECLYYNFVSPVNNGPQSQKFEIELSYSPNSPINDAASYSDSKLSVGDEVTVSSSVLNVRDSAYVQYEWELFENDNANPESWGDPFLKSEIPLASQMTGINLNTFKFKLNFEDPKKFFRVKLTVKENVGKDLFKEGVADIIIPITSNTDKIEVYRAEVTDPTDLTLGMEDSQICEDGTQNALCPVSKNQIIGLKIDASGLSDFMWTVNGRALNHTSCFFENCEEEKQTNVAYFPILEEIGNRYNVNLTAINQSSGEKINLNRSFVVVDPKVQISSADEATCKAVLLGSYIGLDDREWKDYSDINFWALTGSPVKLKVTSEGFSPRAEDYVWLVDGVETTALNAASQGFAFEEGGVLVLPGKKKGESYDVSVGTVYSQSNLIKSALEKHWNVAYGQFYEKPVNDKVIVTMQNFAPTSAKTPSDKIFATVANGLPSYLAFLMRIFLTGLLILVSSRLILSFFPKFRNEK